MYLTLVDTTGIQDYIFGSNRLRENIGASYLVDQATGEWAKTALTSIGPGQEILYAGGGNFVALFDTILKAQEFERLLTQKVICNAPGLQILLVHQSCEKRTVFETLKAAFQEMARKKQERAHSVPLLGLGVTRACASTGLPASKPVKIEDDWFSVSAEIKAKHDNFQSGNERLSAPNSLRPPKGYRFPFDMENLGASLGDQSYIAVVHADGNGMGDEIRNIGKTCGSDDVAYRREIASFSLKVQKAAMNALRGVLADLIESVTDVVDEKGRMNLVIEHPELEMTIPLKPQQSSGKSWYLPFRPIVFGGDDVTFVCDGRLGVALAASYLRRFEEETEKVLKNSLSTKKKLTACAGIAIVKSHYPFARAYKLAAALCQEAKDYRKKVKGDEEEIDVSCLDWHFALSGLSGELSKIREREFVVPAGKLNLRPVTLDVNPAVMQGSHSWKEIKAQVKTFQSEEWAEKRNKMKTLREVLRGGKDSVANFKTIYRLSSDPILTNNGWAGNVCELFDAIELADIYMPLETASETTDAMASETDLEQEGADKHEPAN